MGRWLAVCKYGEPVQQDGAVAKRLTGRGKQKARATVKMILERWDTLQDAYFVESRTDGATIVTAGIHYASLRGR